MRQYDVNLSDANLTGASRSEALWSALPIAYHSGEARFHTVCLNFARAP